MKEKASWAVRSFSASSFEAENWSEQDEEAVGRIVQAARLAPQCDWMRTDPIHKSPATQNYAIEKVAHLAAAFSAPNATRLRMYASSSASVLALHS